MLDAITCSAAVLAVGLAFEACLFLNLPAWLGLGALIAVIIANKGVNHAR